MRERYAILKTAIWILETDGWCQGDLHNAEGQHCALGALEEALLWVPSETTHYLSAMCVLQSQVPGENLAHWNDHPERTFEDVHDAFTKAAKAVKWKLH